VRIISNIIPISGAGFPDFEDRRNIVFIGGFAHPPNADAVLYFVREILPLVKERIPDCVLQLIGSDPTPEILELASTHIQVLGYVPDVRPYFDQARLSVAPIRFGAGVKGKVNQSMSFGVPTVLTQIAAEGMYLVHGQNAMIAEDPQGFADSVVCVWKSRELWERLSVNGMQNLRTHFSVETGAQKIDQLLQWAGLNGMVRRQLESRKRGARSAVAVASAEPSWLYSVS
jgi:glycosyltransferase involved in cell wall biosynthesis